MKTVETFNIKIEHKEPNNCYPNSKEVYVISVEGTDHKESFSIRTSDPHKVLQQDLEFFIKRATNKILGIENKELEL